MQGILIVLSLVSGIGIEFNTGQFVDSGYYASSEGFAVVRVNPLCLGMSSLMSEKTLLPQEGRHVGLSLQKNLNLDVLSDSGVARKPTIMNYAIEGVGGICGGILGGASIGVFLIPFMWLPSDQINVVAIQSIVSIGITVGTAYGVTSAGKFMKQEGSFLKSVVGSTIGLVIGGVVWVLDQQEDISYLFLGSSIGAVIGYNRK